MFESNSVKKTDLDKAIDSVFQEMETVNADSEEYSKMVQQLETLYKIRSSTKDNRVDVNTVVTVAGNLLGIVMILNYERLHIVTTKALGFVMKTKL